MVTPSGALVIDTPGMRELQLWGVDGGVDDAFADIKEFASRCRFTGCGHTNEPGCAVQNALKKGELTQLRFDSYLKLKQEKAASQPKVRKPSALASKPGWNHKSEGQKPFRFRFHQDD